MKGGRRSAWPASMRVRLEKGAARGDGWGSWVWSGYRSVSVARSLGLEDTLVSLALPRSPAPRSPPPFSPRPHLTPRSPPRRSGPHRSLSLPALLPPPSLAPSRACSLSSITTFLPTLIPALALALSLSRSRPLDVRPHVTNTTHAPRICRNTAHRTRSLLYSFPSRPVSLSLSLSRSSPYPNTPPLVYSALRPPQSQSPSRSPDSPRSLAGSPALSSRLHTQRSRRMYHIGCL